MKNTLFVLTLCTFMTACGENSGGEGKNGGVGGGSGLDTTATTYPQNTLAHPNTRPSGSDSSMTDSLPDSTASRKARGLN